MAIFKHAYLKHIDEMRRYYSQDLPCFAGHDWDHISEVVDEAQFICSKLGVEYTLEIEYACILHDIGVTEGRERHHYMGAYMAYKKCINWGFSSEFAEKVMIMVLNHRASSLEDPIILEAIKDNISSLIVNLADRRISRISAETYFRSAVSRSLKYHLAKGESLDEAWVEVEKHFREKFGVGGYAYLNPLINKVRKVPLDEFIQSKLDSEIGFRAEAEKALMDNSDFGLHNI